MSRGVDIELLGTEIAALQDASLRYAKAVIAGSSAAGGAWLDVETAALRYVRKLDEETEKANRPDYLAIAEQAEREATRKRDSEEN